MTAVTPMATLAQAAAMLPGARVVGDAATAFARVHTDTRSMQAGDLFVALRGERFDGHDHLGAARAAGACAALAAHGLAEAGLPGLQVDDPQAALTALAAAWRAGAALPLIGVTGSNGKTTVTQMLAAILHAAHGDAALATQGNLNNHIGVPLTVLRLRRDGAAAHRAAVVELGMNHPGEIAALAAVARPTVGLVNNAQREHLEFMASVEAVARENGQVIESLPADGVAVFPADDAHAPLWRTLAGRRRVLTFALDPAPGDGHGAMIEADVVGRALWQRDHWAVRARTPLGVLDLRVPVAGRHNVRNALAATAAAIAAGQPAAAIVDGLAGFRPVKGRCVVQAVQRGGEPVTLVDDTYNANPDSVRAAIDVLAELPPPQALLLGDMGEVGERGPEFHAEVGAYARERGVATLWAAGALAAHAVAAFGDGARHFDEVPAMVAALPALPPSSSVLVKGSRFMRMERVVQALAAPAATAGGATCC